MDGKDLATAASPDNRFVATVREVDISGSVMVSQPYQVFVEADAYGRRQTDVVYLADKTGAPEIVWVGASTLALCYSSANILEFRNRVYSTNPEGAEVSEAEVVLVRHNEGDACDVSARLASNKSLERGREP